VDNEEWNECEQYETMPGIDGRCEAQYFNRSQQISCEAGYKFRDNENTISTEVSSMGKFIVLDNNY